MLNPSADPLPVFTGLVQCGNIVATDLAGDLVQAEELRDCGHKGVESNQTQQFALI
jgi:hypothetical protein